MLFPLKVWSFQIHEHIVLCLILMGIGQAGVRKNACTMLGVTEISFCPALQQTLVLNPCQQ